MEETTVNKPEPTDYSKEKFTITITACQGGIKQSLSVYNKEDYPSYHEIVGVLEYMKMYMLTKQIQENKAIAEQYNSTQNP